VTAPTSTDELSHVLARSGFARAVDAARHLTACALQGDGLQRVVAACADAPDPDLAVAQICRWIAITGRVPASGLLTRLAQVLGLSTSLGAFLSRHPEHADLLRDSRALAKPRTRKALHDSALRAVRASDDPNAAVRIFKRRELLRVACRDLAGGSSVEEVGRELSFLAEGALRAALVSLEEEHVPPAGARFAVIGMGKLGGEELNYSSDIDVMFVFDAPRDSDGVREWAARMGEGVLSRLAATTEEGQAFRVDASLRPEGKDGPLVRSLAAYRAYYERWAKPWEFQALIKARPVAGDPVLGREFLDLVTPLVYPERLSPEAIREIRHLKARIEKERLGPREDPRTQMKVGTGGLIDVQFTIQLLQLRFGHRDPRLRVPGTIPAIAAATDMGLLDLEKGRWLVETYRFLNRARNVLYLVRGKAQDALPREPEELETFARALGYQAPGARVQFVEDYRRVTRRARRAHEDVFYSDPA
jgi:[glutamine synthetase] adenylyltransferase / [glutamine synthetase]-adenylyl-L-tyrosine phosphorylase